MIKENNKIFRKKIIIIGPSFPYRGGNSLYIQYLYRELIKEFDVSIYNYKLLYPSILFPGTTQFDKSTQPMNPPPSRRLVNSINPFNWIKVARLLKKEKADLIVFDWWHPFFSFCHFTISKLISSAYKNKILFITENFLSHESLFFEKTLTRFGLSNASYFMALSSTVEADLKSTFPSKKIFQSQLPVFGCYDLNPDFNSEKFKMQLGYQTGNKILLFFGYVRKYKGLHVLIESMPEILTKIPEARLLVVGEFYDSEENYTNLITQLQLNDKIKIINRFIPNEEIGNYYSICDLVVLPYLSATQSGVLNVAYGFNKPAIVTKVGGLTDSMENEKTGIIVESGSTKSLADGVARFFELNKTVNFSENVKRKASENLFSKIIFTFNEILKFSNKNQ